MHGGDQKFVQGHCLDLTSPGLQDGIRCIPEHLYWDAVPEESLAALASCSKDASSGTVQQAQVETMRSALAGMTTEAHIIQHSASFARCAARILHSQLSTP